MQHKNNTNSSLLAITDQCKCISDSLKQKTDLELVDLAQSCSTQSASAKTLLIRRYLPKILKESKKIFNGQTRNFWDMDDIIQTGIKAILYAIKSFDKGRSKAFTTVVCQNISKYLNKKKTNYDPMLQFNKGPEFKRVFYNYFKVLQALGKKQNNGRWRLKTEDILKEFNCTPNTLKAVQYAHQAAGNIILSTEDKPASLNAENDDTDIWNYIDYATAQGTIDSTILLPRNPGEELIKKQEKKRDIVKYKYLLTNKEWHLLFLLNAGHAKEKILNHLNISKQRFSFLTKQITEKIQTRKRRTFTNKFKGIYP
jgi:RNA polymerase sigma factor (sigma-70 family)